ncbi:MAG TPA: hypothetical protein VD735_07595 [Candidatus Saccharimonadales bacterium]|nr:hypothetical protein [Candidatus Saccharimonadales bacterium]
MKKFLLLAGAIGAFLAGYGASASFAAYPSGGIHGRGEHNGYFTNANDDMGSEVLRPVYDGESIRPDVNDADSFITFIKHTKLDIDQNGSGDARDKTGAAFIIHTMLGSSTSARSRPPTAAQIADWESRVRYLDSHGKVSWRINYSFTINSYWQATDGGGSNPNDDAFYDENGTKPAIVFRNMSNQVVYAIKWECANPVGTGNLGPVPNTPEFNMYGNTTASINGGSPVISGNVAPGDQVVWRHNLNNNSGPNSTSPDTVAWRVYRDSTILFSGNAGVFAAGTEKLNIQVENFTVPSNAAPGSQICRQLWFTPDTHVSGSSQYAVERCLTVVYNFDLNPMINVTVNGAAPSGGTAEVGDSIAYTYVVDNNGPTISQSTSCTIYRIDRAGSYAAPNPIDSASFPGGYTQPSTGCPRTFAVGNTNLVTETITAAANTTHCRSFFVNPASYGGGAQGVESCIRVVARPYLKVFGGDVLAGGGLETAPGTCSTNANAQVMAWNKRSADGFAGAGAQYAVQALNRIGDFASAQRAGSSAPAPASLSFANTSANTATGNFGGSFGPGAAPCIRDYWADKPATTQSFAGITNMTTGIYASSPNTNIAISGNINPNQRSVLYVDGDVRITGNIEYTGSWNLSSIPQFLLVVKGNIFIDSGVTRLDGNYVSLGDGTTSGGGIIYTCTKPPANQAEVVNPTQLPLGGTMYTQCDDKLTINGSFTANRVDFQRTHGSLKQSTSGEAAGSNAIAEEFVYSPANWIAQPPSAGQTSSYDAISSLPPIL